MSRWPLMKHVVRAAVLVTCAVLLGTTACSNSNPHSPTITEKYSFSGSMSATIDGAAWSSAGAVASFSANDLLVVGGSDLTTGISFGIHAPGPGTYVIPGAGLRAGDNALLSQFDSGVLSLWTADFARGSGTVTLTTLTSTGAAGTFNFNAVANPGTAATGTKSITGGTFNLRF